MALKEELTVSNVPDKTAGNQVRFFTLTQGKGKGDMKRGSTEVRVEERDQDPRSDTITRRRSGIHSFIALPPSIPPFLDAAHPKAHTYNLHNSIP